MSKAIINLQEGTIVNYKGRKGIRINLNKEPYLIALSNEDTYYSKYVGGYYTYSKALEKFSNNTKDYSASDVWRLPTYRELHYSISGASRNIVWCKRNNVYGVYLRYPKLFIPATGFAAYNIVNSINALGYYWTSTIADHLVKTLEITECKCRIRDIDVDYDEPQCNVRLFLKL